MSPWKPITTEAALGVNTGAASNVSNSRYVRLFNTAAVGTDDDSYETKTLNLFKTFQEVTAGSTGCNP